jgi:crossover junction endodeoxyribonuclease RuvC
MFVLGIDPGLTRCGFGAVKRDRHADEAVDFGVLSTSSESELPERLSSMNRQLRTLFARLTPDVVVVERVFFQTNARTAMGVAQASGLALAAAIDQGSRVVQYTSNEVKQAITGFGGADKAQVQHMVQRILKLESLPKPADAADALALALHHLALAGYSSSTESAAARIGASSAAAAERGLGNARIATSFGGGISLQQTPAVAGSKVLRKRTATEVAR